MPHETILITGFAGIVAGAASMAVGEYVSVSSQRDAEEADVRAIERQLDGPPRERHEAEEKLALVYQARGVPVDLSWEVAKALTDKVDDPARAHAKEKANIDEDEFTNPWQAGIASLVSFSAGGAMPLAAAVAFPEPLLRDGAVVGVTLLTLAGTGALSAHLGGAPVGRATARVVVGGMLAIAATHLVGSFFGVDVS